MLRGMSDQPMSRRERNKQRNREEIIEAALDEFSEKGFHDASMQEIADRADFAIGTVYSLFGSKEKLYLELLATYMKKTGSSLRIILEDGDDEYKQLLEYATQKGKLLSEHPKMARIVLYETTGPTTTFKSGLQPIIREQYEFFVRRIASLFQRGIDRGVFRDFGSYYLAVLLDGITNAYLYQALEDPEQHSYEAILEFIQEVFGKIILTEEYRAAMDEE